MEILGFWGSIDLWQWKSNSSKGLRAFTEEGGEEWQNIIGVGRTIPDQETPAKTHPRPRD
eukprot:4878744-Amphidinium_carterae.1